MYSKKIFKFISIYFPESGHHN